MEALQRQTEELRTLNHVNEVIRQVNRALVTATTRSEIERAVCEGLVEAERYRLAWIGDFDVTGSRVEPRATAGEGERYLDLRPADDVGPALSAADVIREGEVVFEGDIAAGDVPGTWREAALGQGFRAAVAVPVGYRTTNYGMLALYADRPGAFDDTERAVLEELGVTIGHAINAAEQRRALTSDTVVECDLTVPPPGPPFVAIAAETGATISLEGAVQRDTGMVEYYEVVGYADAVVAAARDRGVETTVVADYDDRTVVSVRPDEPSVAELVAHHGGVVTATIADGQGGELTVELPEGADIRTVVEAISRANPATELAAQRTTERTATTGLRFRDDLADVLTDRQREVLETAYYAGFFEWPRGNSAEDVAESLSVSPPTFHEHIRHAERKLVRAFLEHTMSQTD